ncbi:hypothetical protein ACI3PL_20720, partial [Lacticaseibacillus paracasei]
MIYGTVTYTTNVFANCIVRVFETSNGRFAGASKTDLAGRYLIEHLRNVEHFVEFTDYTRNYNAVIRSGVFPEAMIPTAPAAPSWTGT